MTEPYLKLRKKYAEALSKNQKSIEAINIASYNKLKQEVNSRYVNLKIIDNDQFIFFTNYNSNKSLEFSEHNQISCTIYWNSINTQVRMKAFIKQTTYSYNKSYFKNRSIEKNALAISSNQSKVIDSYDKVKEKYYLALKNTNLKECPKYWGGFTFSPFEIEFWEGNKHRLNNRNLYIQKENTWKMYTLEP